MIRLLLATAILSLATTATVHAQTWAEVNAGDLPRTAELTVGNGVLSRIQGTLSPDADVDMYVIRVDDPATFSCSTVGGAAYDTQLWMFSLDGRGISFKDDDTSILQSTLTGAFLAEPGKVLIAVARYNNDAEDGAGNELWLDAPFTLERAPDGPGALSPVSAWDGATAGPAGAYTLLLTGASFAAPVVVDQPVVAWAWVNPGVAASFIPSQQYQFNPSGRLITVDRLAPGRFRVDIPDVGTPAGVVHATAYGGNHSAVVSYWTLTGTTLNAFIEIFDGTPAGAMVDAPFTLMYRRGGTPDRREAYLWASDAGSPGPYSPPSLYRWNGTRPIPTISRVPFTVGVYAVTLPGLGAAGPEFGSVQVSAYSGFADAGTLRRAKVDSWSHTGGNVVVTVRTYDEFGAAVNAMFTLSYSEVAAPVPAHLGSGAQVWANDAANPGPYVPHPFWTDSNGTLGPINAETITRILPGQYDVYLPNLAPSNSSIAIATAYGSNPRRAAIGFWGPFGTGTRVRVSTYNSSGVSEDSQFTLLYLTNRAAGVAASNSVICGGCHGLVLNATNRPVVGGGWNLQLTGLPAGVTLTALLVGASTGNTALAPLGAPDCLLCTSAEVVQLLAPPGVYAVPIPPGVALLGAQLHCQGAAFALGINPLGAATSNGLRGLIGDV